MEKPTGWDRSTMTDIPKFGGRDREYGLFKYPLESREVFPSSFYVGGLGRNRAEQGEGEILESKGVAVAGRREARLAWRIETGSIVTALMPLFLPITPLRPRALNDTLNGRPEGNGAVSSRDPSFLRLLPFSKY